MMKALIVTFFEYHLTAWYFFLTDSKIYGVQMVRAMLYLFRNLRKIMLKTCPHPEIKNSFRRGYHEIYGSLLWRCW
jgi:hypothetical protein